MGKIGEHLSASHRVGLCNWYQVVSPRLSDVLEAALLSIMNASVDMMSAGYSVLEASELWITSILGRMSNTRVCPSWPYAVFVCLGRLVSMGVELCLFSALLNFVI